LGFTFHQILFVKSTRDHMCNILSRVTYHWDSDDTINVTCICLLSRLCLPIVNVWPEFQIDENPVMEGIGTEIFTKFHFYHSFSLEKCQIETAEFRMWWISTRLYRIVCVSDPWAGFKRAKSVQKIALAGTFCYKMDFLLVT
jgi:hypothetical protein